MSTEEVVARVDGDVPIRAREKGHGNERAEVDGTARDPPTWGKVASLSYGSRLVVQTSHRRWCGIGHLTGVQSCDHAVGGVFPSRS